MSEPTVVRPPSFVLINFLIMTFFLLHSNWFRSFFCFSPLVAFTGHSDTALATPSGQPFECAAPIKTWHAVHTCCAFYYVDRPSNRAAEHIFLTFFSTLFLLNLFFPFRFSNRSKLWSKLHSPVDPFDSDSDAAVGCCTQFI